MVEDIFAVEIEEQADEVITTPGGYPGGAGGPGPVKP